jgi:hypothetical protein
LIHRKFLRNKLLLPNPIPLAQTEATSFCGGVRHKRYSEWLEIASNKKI